jgi:hypothetical protein
VPRDWPPSWFICHPWPRSRRQAAGADHDHGQVRTLFMILARNRRYAPRTGHDHGLSHILAMISVSWRRVSRGRGSGACRRPSVAVPDPDPGAGCVTAGTRVTAGTCGPAWDLWPRSGPAAPPGTCGLAWDLWPRPGPAAPPGTCGLAWDLWPRPGPVTPFGTCGLAWDLWPRLGPAGSAGASLVAAAGVVGGLRRSFASRCSHSGPRLIYSALQIRVRPLIRGIHLGMATRKRSFA